MQENSPLRIFLAITAALAVAYTFFMLGAWYGRKHAQILYISQDEIITLEKTRIKDESPEGKQLFFGKPDTAVKYIEKEQDRMTKDGNVVLLTDNKIYGNNVYSVSKEVHRKIIDRLREDQR